jgi:hypothetical protein
VAPVKDKPEVQSIVSSAKLDHISPLLMESNWDIARTVEVELQPEDVDKWQMKQSIKELQEEVERLKIQLLAKENPNVVIDMPQEPELTPWQEIEPDDYPRFYV